MGWLRELLARLGLLEITGTAVVGSQVSITPTWGRLAVTGCLWTADRGRRPGVLRRRARRSRSRRR